MSTPIIPWVGGKRRLAKHILPLFPAHTCYIEPFCGGAALYFLKETSKVEVINDVNGELINLYRVIKNHLEEFVRQFKWALTSRQVFEWTKAFGGKVDGQTFGTSTTRPTGLNLLRLEETLSAAHLRLSRTMIEHMGWADCVEKYDRPHSLFYLDPPYWQTCGYGVEFGLDQYTQMAQLARSIKGSMIISVNDIPEMRDVFKGLHMDTVSLKYSLGDNKKQANELIIRNF
ncbi:D12 class N6 adenine-specific DNA methyltransferase [Yersinia wautersii]|uniref:D12 class N6 adenine-specific DNA methyltransferase n=2 Tax=Yersinia wautersii TaxID=1341643 RepID=A0ABM9TB39_9GAMM|nr:DNA adenine methylase [Yersinia wautersii]CRG48968.1 D12 class N6 adenine-specific DNA methyltransferase [Yersinia wautersii]